MYATPLCALSRANLLSGTDHHLVGMGTMLTPTGGQVGADGYEGYLTDRALTLAELLRDSGYHTYMAGKWHLGMEENQGPKARGFESSFALLNGFADHFVPTAGRLTKSESYVYREGANVVRPPADYYSTNYFTDRLIFYIDRNKNDGRPFFVYAAYTSPHWPLQAPDEFLDRYRGR